MTLFDELVSAIEPILRSVSPFILTRLLLRAGILERDTMTAAQFERVLPAIETGLRESLSPADYAAVTSRLREVSARRLAPR